MGDSVSVLQGYEKIVVIFLLVLIGFFLKKKNIITNQFKSDLTDLLFKLIIPFAVFMSFLSQDFSTENLKKAGIVILASLLFYPVVQLLLGKLLYIKVGDSAKQRILTFETTYGNQTFMGLPFTQALFGNEGLFIASMFNLPYNFFLWSMGFAGLTKQPTNKKGVKDTLTNPIILACAAGFVVWVILGFLPSAVTTSLQPIWDVGSAVGGCNTPLSMIIIGAMLADAHFGEVVKEKIVWLFAAAKHLIVPGIFFLVLWLLGFRGLQLAVPVLMAAMPGCVTGGMIANKFKIRPDYAASVITFSTALSAITIPIWLVILINIA
jgi:predicted permease